jgi:hypothetical protein
VDSTQRQVMKADQVEDESGSFGWLLFFSVILIAGGVALILASASTTALIAGGTLAFMGVALVVGAVAARATGRRDA